MKNPLALRRDPIKTAEAELATLRSQREKLDGRRSGVVTDLDARRVRRKADLAADVGADLSGHAVAIRNFEDDLATIDNALADLAIEIESAEAKRAELADGEARQRLATELTAVGDAFERAAAAMDKALAGVGEAFEAMRAAVPESLAVVSLGSRPGNREEKGPATGRELAAIVLVEALARVVPDAFDKTYHYSKNVIGATSASRQLVRFGGLAQEEPSDKIAVDFADTAGETARDAARSLVGDRLRRRAGQIVAGELPADLMDIQPPEPPAPRVEQQRSSTCRDVFVLRDLKYRTSEASPIRLVRGGMDQTLPAPVADVALARGAAADSDTDCGLQIVRQYKSQRVGKGGPAGFMLDADQCLDLGIITVSADTVDELRRSA